MNTVNLLVVLLLAHTVMATSQEKIDRLLHERFSSLGNPLLSSKQTVQFRNIVDSGNYQELLKFLSYIKDLQFQSEGNIEIFGEGSGAYGESGADDGSGAYDGSGTDDESSAYDGSGTDDGSGSSPVSGPVVIDELEDFSGSGHDQESSGFAEVPEIRLKLSNSRKETSSPLLAESTTTAMTNYTASHGMTTEVIASSSSEGSWNHGNTWLNLQFYSGTDRPYVESTSPTSATDRSTTIVKENFSSIKDYSWTDANLNFGHDRFTFTVPLTLFIGGCITILLIVLLAVFTICVCRRRRQSYSRRYRQFEDADQLLEDEKPHYII